jgi:uridine kinase
MQVQSNTKPHIVGIAGGSCAGKTWLADRLQKHLGPRAARLSLDNFYHDQSHLSPARRARLNFDRPHAIDWPRLEQVLSNLSQGAAAAVPRYDYVTHARLRDESVLSPAPVLIVEGLWLFRRPALRRFFHLKVYIRSSPELCTQRRLHRDTTERGRTAEQVLAQLHRHTLPMFQRFVAPQEKWADLLIDAPVQEEDVRNLVNKIESRTKLSVTASPFNKSPLNRSTTQASPSNESPFNHSTIQQFRPL